MLQENFTKLDTALHQDYNLLLPVNDAQEIIKGAVNSLFSPAKQQLLASGLWPQDKSITSLRWDERLESLWYEQFYIWKNANLYLKTPVTSPMDVLQVRSDRKSAFDIKLWLEIEWTWEIQTQISNIAAEFIEKHGWKTCYKELPADIPQELRDRCQLMELCRPLTIKINWEERWLELIERNYLTGSLYKKFHKKRIENPYGVDVPVNMKEFDKFPQPIFTPTTKENDWDAPINSDLVREQFPEQIALVEKIIAEFTAEMYDQGYIVVDWKVELFINSKWEVVFWDELLTSESFRFIKREDFEQGIYKVQWKQIMRTVLEKIEFEDRVAEFMEIDENTWETKLKGIFDPIINNTIVTSYTHIQEAMKRII